MRGQTSLTEVEMNDQMVRDTGEPLSFPHHLLHL